MNFLSALNGEDHERIPVWFMRQAGRYLREYQELRLTHSIKEICKDPEIVSDISYLPVEKLGVDAAIIFSDILLPFESMGIDLEYRENIGPVLSEFKGLENILPFDINEFSYPLSLSIKKFKEKHRKTPLIGFTGGPVTLASYLIAGKSDRDLSVTKKFMLKNPSEFVKILDIITDMVIQIARYQKDAGTDVIQIFDSWAGALTSSQFRNIYSGFLNEIRNELNFPVIYFSTGTGSMIEDLVETGFDFLSLDWRCDLTSIKDRIDASIGLQGNLDPLTAESNLKAALRESREILNGMKEKNNYIFNLGHGVLPRTDPETLKKIVEEVHSFDR